MLPPAPAEQRTQATQFMPWPDALEQPAVEIVTIAEPTMNRGDGKEQAAASQPEVEPAQAPPVQRALPGKAVQQLRGAPVDGLNMVQLLERFAVALEDHRLHSNVAADFGTISPSEALDALSYPVDDKTNGHLRTGVSVRTRAIETENALREALSKLDRLSGAA